jgi:aryl-alcohol dehydrogenase-like predicted oxidoreductase
MSETTTMPTGHLPGIAKPLSRLIQGCMMLQEGDGLAASFAILDAAWASGITTFDNGHVYGGGSCDRVFGAWARDRGLVDQVVMLAKGAHHNQDRKRVTPFDVEADVADSLARSGLTCLDVWLFHRDDPQQSVGPLVEICADLIRQGRIAAWGVSNWTVPRLQEAMNYAKAHDLPQPVCSSPNFSLAEQIDSPWGDDCITISGPAHAADRQWYADSGLAVMTWSSLARGFLSGRMTQANFEAVRDEFEEHCIRCYVCDDNWQRLARLEELAARRGASVPQMALAYVLNQPFDGFALVGARNARELADNLAATTISLSPEDIAWLDLSAEAAPI